MIGHLVKRARERRERAPQGRRPGCHPVRLRRMFGRAEQYHFRPLENANDYRNELRLLATLIDGCNINPAIGVRLRQIADAVVAVVAPREGTEGQ